MKELRTLWNLYKKAESEFGLDSQEAYDAYMLWSLKKYDLSLAVSSKLDWIN